jgi:cytochrome c553
MKGKFTRMLFGVLVLALAVFAVGVQPAAAQAAPAAAAPAPVPTAADKSEVFFKNIQVLKGLPADLMQPSMQMMEISLGVHCAYCHDPDGAKRELDTNPKKAIARNMLRMVDEINKTTFNGRAVVNCYTCHRGTTNPTVVLPFNGEEPDSISTSAMPPTVDQLLNNYTNVLGGADNLAKLAGRTLKGTLTNYAHIDQVHPERAPTTVTPIEIVAKGQDKRMVIQHNINADAVNTNNGAAGWIRAGAGPARDMRADELAVARLENAVIAPAGFKTLLTNLKVLGQEKIGEHTAWVVLGNNPQLPQVKLFFDRDTSYLLSVQYQQKSYFCCHVFRIDYDNYYITNGVRMPMTWTINGPRENKIVYTIDTVQVSPVEDNRFARPGVQTAAR